MRPTYPSLRRRPFVTPIWLSLLAALLAVGVLSFIGWEGSRAYPTSIVVMGRARTEPAMGDDARAALLSRLWGEGMGWGHLDAIVVPASARDRAMVAPLAANLGLHPIVESDDDPRQLAHRLLREHAGKRILVLVDAAAVTGIVESLAGAGTGAVPLNGDFGTLYVVTVPRFGHADVLKINR